MQDSAPRRIQSLGPLCAPQTTAALVITPMVNRFVIASEKQLPPYHETALASRNTTCTRQKCEERV
ncbi:hypothetical protein MSG28_006946 [Choristoneura fumiferana]|uniref:Uncharacterized protein n=1 Tax=Choristoneura fumiferana TaxID=7141 RepID=A0ACC0JM42_CHOFU|nr:hypothetical protein MSG28_006946 [Choristoneura fumiferana]